VRSDMAKVIVERPRFGSRDRGKPKGYKRRLTRFGADGPPIREGMKTRSLGGTKRLNEHLGPLRRYLNSQVGRPWDHIFSEICAHINRDSAVQDHVRDHIDDFVTTDVIVIDGIPCQGANGWRFGRPLHEGLPWRSLYVCPHSGLLKRVKAIKKLPDRRDPKPEFVKVSATEVCKYLAGVWHLVTVRPLPEDRSACRQRDVVLGRAVADIEPCLAFKHYGAAVYAVATRRLAQREIRQLPIPVDARI
jgi:hypothetical protein